MREAQNIPRICLLESRFKHVGNALASLRDDTTVDATDPVELGLPPEPLTALPSALDLMLEGEIGALIVGATSSLRVALPRILKHSLNPRRPRCFAIATIRTRSAAGVPVRDFVLADPCVTPEPSAEGLASMAVRASAIAPRLVNGPYLAAFLSHLTLNVRSLERGNILLEAWTAAHSQLGDVLIDTVFQLDTALVPRSAHVKARNVSTLPNILVCSNLSQANAVYKAFEALGRDRVYLAGAVLVGLSKGFVGLLPRTCEVDEVRRLVHDLGTLLRSEEQ